MARTNTYTCRTCGTKYEFCLKCQVARPDYDAENFCSKEHNAIYAILSKHGCNLITSDEALKELSEYNLDEITFAEDVLAHIERIKSETKVTSVVEENVAAPVEEQPTVKTTNKNKKKKW